MRARHLWLLLLLSACAQTPPKPAEPVADPSPSLTISKPVPPKEDELRAKAQGGDAAAQMALGRYLIERGPYFDPSPEGVSWLEKAAGQGLVDAKLTLALRYKAVYCQGPKAEFRHCQKAYQWFTAAAQTGDTSAMTGLISLLSVPPTENIEEAYFWAMIRLRQKPMPPAAWVEESQTLRAKLPIEQALMMERKVSKWKAVK